MKADKNELNLNKYTIFSPKSKNAFEFFMTTSLLNNSSLNYLKSWGSSKIYEGVYPH